MTAYMPSDDHPTAFSWAGHEWRVVVHRREWKRGPQTRKFEREHDARAYMAKLLSGGRPDLSALDRLDLDARLVGYWLEVEL